MVITVILIIVTLIAVLEIPPLLKKGMKKELWSFSVFMVVGTVLSIGMVLELKIPNPLDWITMIYQPMHDWVFEILS